MKNTATYSKVLFIKAITTDSLSKVIHDIEIFIMLLNQSNLVKRFFTSPTKSIESKNRLLNTLNSEVKFDILTKNFLEILIQNARITEINAIYEKLIELKLESEGITKAILTSAKKLSKTEIKKCQVILEKKLGKKFIIEHNINPAIIGGFTFRFGNNIYDASVDGALKKIRLLGS